MTTVADIVLHGGRVIDPESGLDDIFDVAISGNRIEVVSPEPLEGRLVLDVAGKVVAPGFIDLHSHGQAIPEQRLQALDGVTTALDLEAGRSPVSLSYRRAASEGRPIHYGYSASWAVSRMRQAGLLAPGEEGALVHIGNAAWQVPRPPGGLAELLATLRTDLEEGAIGIGILVGYAQETEPAEYLAVARLASEASMPTFTHARDLAEVRPSALIDGAEEIVRAAAETGAHMHYCHVNSTSTRHVERVLELVERARRKGATVTTEAYPYGAGMTSIGASFLAPERLAERGLSPSSIRYLPTGEWVRDAERLNAIRSSDPGALALVRFLDDEDPGEFSFVRAALTFPRGVVASDAIDFSWPEGEVDPYAWPLPDGVMTHPRSAGNFSRYLRLVRELGLCTLTEAIARCSLWPAEILEKAAPALARKGRLRAGCDADIVVFDPERVTDTATYEETTSPSSGISEVLVDGTFVVREGELVRDALPGRAITSAL